MKPGKMDFPMVSMGSVGGVGGTSVPRAIFLMNAGTSMSAGQALMHGASKQPGHRRASTRASCGRRSGWISAKVGARVGAGWLTVMMFVQSLHGISHPRIEDTREAHGEFCVRARDGRTDKTMAWIAQAG